MRHLARTADALAAREISHSVGGPFAPQGCPKAASVDLIANLRLLVPYVRKSGRIRPYLYGLYGVPTAYGRTVPDAPECHTIRYGCRTVRTDDSAACAWDVRVFATSTAWVADIDVLYSHLVP
ncbi:hypothetical protein GGX14DRAFT_579769 [Mycena pura]|uniref:Uncharacterized protein n=1 Tax=Mycena pura TaxID=153505 RepID=A0AAD6UM12_9AGAR|nr:hypothetical protein GGX14DRAFT_579769 [Mycena pura]